jgi:hypothetical protein
VEEILGMMIPLTSVVLGISVAIIWVVTRHRRDVHELEHRHKERMAAIEKGLELPPEPVVPQNSHSGKTSPTDGSRYLLRGLVWTGVGLALALAEDHMDRFHSYGWIAVAVGVAYLIYYFAEGRKAAPPQAGGSPPVDGGKS